MTVSTVSPVPSDLDLQISVGDAGVATAAQAGIPAGSSSGNFTVTGLANGVVTIPATANGSSITAHGQVTVPAGTMDSDGDGTPDAVDPCPLAANPPINGVPLSCPATIYDLTTGSPPQDDFVLLSNVTITTVHGTPVTIAPPGDAAYRLHFDPQLGFLGITLGMLSVPMPGSIINLQGNVVSGTQLTPTGITVICSACRAIS